MSCFACLGGGAEGGGRRRKKKGGKTLKLMLVGLDGAGKSTLLQAILGEPFEKTMPTFGFNNASTSRDGFDVDLFDLGGGKRIRGIWKAYTADVHGCVFVVDAANEARFSESREVFAETLRDPHLSGKPVLVCANKQDLPGAKTVAEVAEALGLATLQNDRHRVVPCVAAREDARAEPDASVDVGMRWMMERVGEDWDELNPRVVAEAEAYREKEEALKRERLERGKEARRERLEAEAREAEAREKNEEVQPPGTPERRADVDSVSAAAETPTSPEMLSPLKETNKNGAFGSPLDDVPAPPGGVWTPAPDEDAGNAR